MYLDGETLLFIFVAGVRLSGEGTGGQEAPRGRGRGEAFVQAAVKVISGGGVNGKFCFFLSTGGGG